MNRDNKLRVVFVRHGESKYNIEKRLQGPQDTLTEEGKKQIEKLCKELAKYNFTEMITSNEKRAVESAEIISNFLNLEFQSTALICEKGSGDFSDKLVKDVNWNLVSGTFLDKKIPNGDSVRDVMIRAIEFFRDLNRFPQGKEILVMSHGTFLRILFCLIFNKNIEEYLLDYEFPNAGILIISRNEKGRWEVENSDIRRKR